MGFRVQEVEEFFSVREFHEYPGIRPVMHPANIRTSWKIGPGGPIGSASLSRCVLTISI